MPVRPDGVGGKTDMQAAQAWIEYIDAKLLISSKSLNYTGHSFDVPNGMMQNTREYVMEQYRNAGWSVSYHSEQRDGEWITLKLDGGVNSMNYRD